MRKTFIYIIGIAAIAFAASSCHDEVDVNGQTYTVGEADNVIQLSAGIVEGNGEVTRAGAEDNHAKHGILTTGTKLALRVSGTWTSSDVIKTTTATVGTEIEEGTPAVGTKHNGLTLSPQLYWDDYGTADPANSSTGRAAGLTIYGVAINGETTLPSTLSSISGESNKDLSKWTALSWTLAADQASGINAGDLLISNNIQTSENVSLDRFDCGTYKFDSRAAGKLLEFRHAMSKITVNLTAGDGFDADNFKDEPTVTLHGFNTTGKVNITNGTIIDPTNATNITTYYGTSPWASTGSVTRTAIVYPNRTLQAKDGSTAADEIATINADGNVYTVTADSIVAAINGTGSTSKTAQILPGKNYILNITVNKTAIVVTATVTDWVDVTAKTEEPLIDVGTDIGTATSIDMDKSFSFFCSEAEEDGYGTATGDFYSANSEYVWEESSYTVTPQLYWPTHSTAYYFRGIYPQVTVTSEANKTRITKSGGKQVVAVSNSAWDANTFPCNFMIGAPRDAAGKALATGQTATEGNVNLNFQYAMSRVTVKIKSSGTEAAKDIVKFDNGITEDPASDDTKIEILYAYSNGSIGIGKEDSIMGTQTNGTAGYPLNLTSDKINTTTNTATFDDVILPQSLGSGATALKFKITVRNADNSFDTYTSKAISEIKVKIGTTSYGSDDTGATNITGWASGYHYIYELDVKKTGITVTATLTNWTDVSASENIWF